MQGVRVAVNYSHFNLRSPASPASPGEKCLAILRQLLWKCMTYTAAAPFEVSSLLSCRRRELTVRDIQ